MISREEIENLANLSRLHITEKEIEELQKDFGAILEYVGQIQDAGDSAAEVSPHRNVMREDIERNTDLLSGKQEKILASAPKREDNYIVVRKIIERDEPTL